MSKIKKTSSGKYHTMVFIGYDAAGKRKYKSITAPTVREVKKLAAKAITDGVNVPYEALTLAQAYDRYIDSKSNTLSPSTLREYKRASKNDFPKLLPYQLRQLSNEIIQTAVNELVEKNSPKTIRNKCFLLCTVLKEYHPDLRLNIRLPRKKKTRVITQTDNTIARLLLYADEKLRVPILLAAFAGLRRSEICALTPEDFTAEGVSITKAKVRGEGGYVIGPPKTDAGYRTVPMDKALLEECKKWKYFGRNPDTLTKNYISLQKKTGVTATFHKLRHYYGTNIIISGVDLMTACSYGGWQDPQVLLKHYAHDKRTKETDNKVISIFTAYENADKKQA